MVVFSLNLVKSPRWRIVLSSLVVLFLITLMLMQVSMAVGSDNDGSNNHFREDSGVQPHTDLEDVDGDGLSDVLEIELGTNVTDKYGDFDSDGLYDFEEYLDLYGTPHNKTDTQRYNYSIDRTHDGVLDIYHLHGISKDKSGYIRDQEITEEERLINFNDMLIWNVTISSYHSFDGNRTYTSNFFMDVSFTSNYKDDSLRGSVEYIDNIFQTVQFNGEYAGGSLVGSVQYENNSFHDVSFEGYHSGGSSDGDVSYVNNLFKEVSFAGFYSGGSQNGYLIYQTNFFENVNFSGAFSAASDEYLLYLSNTFTHVSFGGQSAGGGAQILGQYLNNKFNSVKLSGEGALRSDVTIDWGNQILDDTYDTDGDMITDLVERFELGTNPILTGALNTEGEQITDDVSVFSDDVGVLDSVEDRNAFFTIAIICFIPFFLIVLSVFVFQFRMKEIRQYLNL